MLRNKFGKNNPFFGKKHTEESKLKMRLSHLGKGHSIDEETRKKISIANKGKTKKDYPKLSNSGVKKGYIPWNKGKKQPQTSGKNNYNWKGGISRKYKEGYWSTEYLLWRKLVFERDNYTCQVCKKVGIYLTAHHIKSWAHYPELRYEINNGITLCEVCHSLTDNYRGRARSKKP
jgi:hypothetical protein